MIDDLFEAGVPEDSGPRRSPNRSGRRAPMAIALTFTEAELDGLKHNDPGPSGDLGGWGRFENWLLDNTDVQGVCVFDPLHWMRLTIYHKSYDNGGPNNRVRAACGPALERIGIILKPGWGAST